MRKKKILLDEVLISIYSDGTLEIERLDDSNLRAETMRAIRRILQRIKKYKRVKV